ncbi:MAG: hypothetical protein HYR96_00440 [Deltaproteobacteria bacterium]|nr:hypothetical protein [Deltaproteobacteria bacterium]
MNYDLARLRPEQLESYWDEKKPNHFPTGTFEHPGIWFELGAGTGWFFTSLAAQHPDKRLIAIERSRMRGRRLVQRCKRTGLANILGFRGNAIGALVNEVPTESLERLYILYPCPWLRNSQRKNRWYLHPLMKHFHRVLKPEGLMIWASDREFYINEAEYVCRTQYNLKGLAWGQITPNPYNHLDQFPQGRTKFEFTFLQSGQPCYELIVTKS